MELAPEYMCSAADCAVKDRALLGFTSPKMDTGLILTDLLN